MLINVKMTTIVGILTFMSRIHFVLSWVEHEKRFITSGPDNVVCHNLFLFHFNENYATSMDLNQTANLGPHHFAIAGLSNRNVIFLFLNQNICCGCSNTQWDGSFKHPKHIIKIKGKKIFTILRWNRFESSLRCITGSTMLLVLFYKLKIKIFTLNNSLEIHEKLNYNDDHDLMAILYCIYMPMKLLIFNKVSKMLSFKTK